MQSVPGQVSVAARKGVMSAKDNRQGISHYDS